MRGARDKRVERDNDDGHSADTGGELHLFGRGVELWGNDNEFASLYRTDIVEDFDVSVQVTSMTNTHAWAKAGFVVADDLTNLSAGGYLVMGVTPSSYGAFVNADLDGNGALENNWQTDSALTFGDVWIRLVRTGNTFTSYYKESQGASSPSLRV